MKGKWEHQPDHLFTNAAGSKIEFLSPGSRVSLISQSGKLEVQIDGAPVRDVFRQKDLQPDESGRTVINIENSRLVAILKNLTPGKTKVSIQLPQNATVGMGIYCIYGEI